MLKQQVIKIIVALALVAAVTGASGIVADTLGLSVTPQTFACPSSSGSGGGC